MRAAGIHTAVLIADVMPELHPEWFDPTQRQLFGRWLRSHLRDTELFLCISRRTSEDLREVAAEIGMPRPNTVVVPLGADFAALDPQPVSLPPNIGKFLLVVGTLEPRKNQQLVVDAFDVLRRRHPDLGVVIVGKQGWLVDDLVEHITSHPEFGQRLVWLEGIDDAQLAWLYEQAFLAVAPSRYEGLGVPVMEALHHGCPTISSNGGALPEAGGDRVSMIDPDDIDGLCVLVERHLLDPEFHAHAVELAKGYESPRWTTTASAVGDALRDLAERTPPLVPGGSGGHR
jgi:glycosyltransferase involved in cell wall biosynthesis